MPASSIRFRRLTGDRRGSLLLETALIMPILVTFILGSVELGRYVLLNQKMAQTATTIADLATRGDALTRSELDAMLDSAQHVMRPFTLGAEGVVIVSSVTGQAGNAATVNWQYRGAGSLSAPSRIGTPGGPAILDPGVVLAQGETVIVTEVEYHYTPSFLKDLVTGSAVYHDAMFRPRRGEPTTLQ